MAIGAIVKVAKLIGKGVKAVQKSQAKKASNRANNKEIKKETKGMNSDQRSQHMRERTAKSVNKLNTQIKSSSERIKNAADSLRSEARIKEGIESGSRAYKAATSKKSETKNADNKTGANPAKSRVGSPMTVSNQYSQNEERKRKEKK